MNIGVNCVRIDPGYSGGLNTYVLGLLGGFAQAGNGHRFQLYVTAANHPLFAQFSAKRNFDVFSIDDRTLGLRLSLCRATLLLRNERLFELTSDIAFNRLRKTMEERSDLIYTPTVVLQSFDNRKPTVLSIHDIQHLHYPEFLSWPVRLSRTVSYALSARRADCVQASSNFVKEDLLAHYPALTPQQIEVIPEGVNLEDFSAKRDNSALLVRYRIPKRFLFYPAQLWPHKNHLTILKALKILETRENLKVPLVLTGARYGAAHSTFQFIRNQRMDYVLYLGRVPFEDIVGLYQQASAVVSASLHESSSLPILEAAAAGTPIIASRIPPHQEHAKLLRISLFDALDAEQLAELVYRLWLDRQSLASQVEDNRRCVSAFSWTNAANKYINLFQSMVN